MKQIYYVSILMLIFLLSCSKPDGILSINVPVTNIDGLINKVPLPEDCIINPKSILAVGDYVVMLNDNTDYVLAILNTANSKIQYLQSKGKGPEELLNGNQMGIYPDSSHSSFYIHDDFKNVLFIYKLNEDLFELDSIVEIDKFNLVAIDSNIIFGVPSVEAGRYMAIKSDKSCVKFGDYSEYESSNIPTDNTLSTGYAILDADKHRFAWVSLYGESFKLFDYSNLESIRELEKECYRKPVFDQEAFKNKNAVILYPETVLGFTSLTNGSEHIYALYSGKTIKDFIDKRESALYGNNIVVFDWDGNYIKRLNSKNPIINISYNSENNRLYALMLSNNIEYELVYLKL